MSMRDCSQLMAVVGREIQDTLRVVPLPNGACMLSMPFLDAYGDPITVVVRRQGEAFIVDDGGRIAGELFSVGQSSPESYVYRLLQSLATAYGLQVDFDRGTVASITPQDELSYAVLNLTKVVLAVVTVTPHLGIRTRRIRRFGRRLRKRIREQYQAHKVLDLVDPHFQMPGATVEAWPIDFHWQVTEDASRRDVCIVAVDLDVSEPLRKAEHLAALAVDARAYIRQNSLRIVLDRHGRNSEAQVASAFLTQHQVSLGYALFDFGLESDARRFIGQSVEELLGDQTAAWRDIWLETRPL